jgi:virulence-associated protein VagC
MANKNMRTVKIYGMSGYKYQATPTIMLKGKWLEELGFEIGDYITVSCEDGKLIITPDTERVALAKAEQEFMEREMASLNKRFQKEKERLHRCYLKYIMLSHNFIDVVNMSTYGAKMPRANWDFIGNIKAPFPPINVQTDIANLLENRLKDIDDLISEKISLIDDLEIFKRSLIYEVVTGKRKVV